MMNVDMKLCGDRGDKIVDPGLRPGIHHCHLIHTPQQVCLIHYCSCGVAWNDEGRIYASVDTAAVLGVVRTVLA